MVLLLKDPLYQRNPFLYEIDKRFPDPVIIDRFRYEQLIPKSQVLPIRFSFMNFLQHPIAIPQDFLVVGSDFLESRVGEAADLVEKIPSQ